ncbi:hypothetical protein [Aeromicrobium wangtongii]|uniref:hypothetical protein n=1 Tax=Aeromicrobium wangtongii TaxID=2969247 RepID=UPI00201808C4|nr:hypothetical protein [Aeromicrobium wangtongii]MCL3820188.1 hypothetical protein [Aeromicrobium wangtongii]
MVGDRLIGRAATSLLDRDHAAIPPEELPLWERAEALKILRRECDSWTRLGAGLVAWVGAVVGAAALAAVVSHDAPVWLRIVCLVAGAALVIGSWRLGHRAWLAGRRVIDAYCWWTLLPERMPQGGAGVDGWRANPVVDAVQARLFVFEGARVVRIALAAVSMLAPLAFLDTLDRGPRASWYEGETTSLWLFCLAFLTVGLGTGAVLLWGQFRAARAYTERDPVQRWLLRRDR